MMKNVAIGIKYRMFCLFLLIAAALFCSAGCISVPEESFGTPIPSAGPSPTPEAFNIVLTAEPLPTDILQRIVEGDEHYFDYLSFGDIRIYEYENDTFLDGICFNNYPAPLEGGIRILFHTNDGKICGEGTLHNAQGNLILKPGSNAVYAEILTDISLLSYDFSLEITESFHPVE